MLLLCRPHKTPDLLQHTQIQGSLTYQKKISIQYWKIIVDVSYWKLWLSIRCFPDYILKYHFHFMYFFDGSVSFDYWNLISTFPCKIMWQKLTFWGIVLHIHFVFLKPLQIFLPGAEILFLLINIFWYENLSTLQVCVNFIYI